LTGRNTNYVKDHLIPIRHGGTDWPNNIALTCQQCNQGKWTQTECEFWSAIRKQKGKSWVQTRKNLWKRLHPQKLALTEQRKQKG
jgi:hypothetical protein